MFKEKLKGIHQERQYVMVIWKREGGEERREYVERRPYRQTEEVEIAQGNEWHPRLLYWLASRKEFTKCGRTEAHRERVQYRRDFAGIVQYWQAEISPASNTKLNTENKKKIKKQKKSSKRTGFLGNIAMDTELRPYPPE